MAYCRKLLIRITSLLSLPLVSSSCLRRATVGVLGLIDDVVSPTIEFASYVASKGIANEAAKPVSLLRSKTRVLIVNSSLVGSEFHVFASRDWKDE